MAINPSVNIAQFKAKMGQFLKIVRKGGRLLLLDRQTPIAQLIPAEPLPSLPLIPPAASFSQVKALLRMIPPLATSTDSLSTLKAMRQRDRRR